MGLDMYLRGKRFLSSYFNKGDDKIAAHIQKMFPELASIAGRHGDTSPVSEVSIQAVYWRKANAIHKWFVDNVQGGEDDCDNYGVSRDQLEELRTLCGSVIEDHALASTLLPSASGFFFGSTDYDEHYFKDIEYTHKELTKVLALPRSWEFEYHSSW